MMVPHFPQSICACTPGNASNCSMTSRTRSVFTPATNSFRMLIPPSYRNEIAGSRDRRNCPRTSGDPVNPIAGGSAGARQQRQQFTAQAAAAAGDEDEHGRSLPGRAPHHRPSCPRPPRRRARLGTPEAWMPR